MGVPIRQCGRSALCGLALLVLAGGVNTVAAPGRPVHGAKPSAEEIIAKNAAARGGLDAWRKVQSLIWVGHIESAHAPQGSMLFELQQQRPNKTRLEITAHGQKTVRVFDGSQGWKLGAAQSGAAPAAQPYTTEELRFARAGQGIDGPLIDAAARGNLVTLEGLEELDGRKAWRLEVRLPGGERDQLWIDAKTFLDIRCDRVTDGPGPAGLPRHIVSLFYRDYRSFDRLKIPSIIESAAGAGGPPDRMVIERVLVNPPLDQRAFVMPATPHPRFRTLPGNPAAPSTG